jgi:heme A synthase
VREFLSYLHQMTYFQIVFTGTVGLVWGIWAWRRGEYTNGLRSILYVTAGSGLLEALIGSILFISGCRPGNILHLVYGLIIIAAIPVAYVYINEKIAKRDLAVLAFAVFALVAAAFRSGATGPGTCPT